MSGAMFEYLDTEVALKSVFTVDNCQFISRLE